MTSSTTSVNVFCGSGSGNDPAFLRAAEQMGCALARAGREVVYGGGQSGLMGAVAASASAAGGRVHGVIPTAFLPTNYKDRILAPGERETTTASMHERKAIMSRESCAFVGLPGGFGTLEECAEMTTWTQLGIHRKPVVLLNVRGFYTPLRAFINGAISSGFIAEQNRSFMLFVDEDTEDPAFDWGEAALAAINKWEKDGAGGGKAFSLEWPAERREQLQ